MRSTTTSGGLQRHSSTGMKTDYTLITNMLFVQQSEADKQ